MSRRPSCLTASRHHLAAGGLVGDVDLEHRRLDAELGELGRGGLRLLDVAAGDGDRGAGLRQAARHAEPDAAVAARDDARRGP